MGKIIFLVKEFSLFLIRIFFLQLYGWERCVICGNKTLYFPVCGECRKRFFSLDDVLNVKRCRYCGKELVSTEESCLQCRESLVLKHTDFVVPMFNYRLWNKQLMFLWKKKDVRSLSYLFASFYGKVLKQIGVKVIVPVPPRPEKIRENGWDQIDEVCSFLRWCFGFELFDILQRVSVSEQKKLDRKGRLETIGSAYKLCNKKKLKNVLKRFGNIVPQEVCVIDDVSTTGATLESCSSILKDFGIPKVIAVTLFIVN